MGEERDFLARRREVLRARPLALNGALFREDFEVPPSAWDRTAHPQSPTRIGGGGGCMVTKERGLHLGPLQGQEQQDPSALTPSLPIR